MAHFACSQCSHSHNAPDAYIGRSAKCNKCGASSVITAERKLPSETTSADPPAPPLPPGSAANADREDAPSRAATVSSSSVRVAIGLLAALLLTQWFGLASTKASSTRWEYMIEAPGDSTLSVALDRLGSEGWELVSARRATSDFGPVSYEMIFKRPR